MATARQDPWGQRYDPYSSRITFETQGACEQKAPLVASKLLLSRETSAPVVALSPPCHEIPHKAPRHVRSVPSATATVEGSNSSEIEDLKRRLQHIKIRRAMQREHTQSIQQELKEMEMFSVFSGKNSILKPPEVLTNGMVEEAPASAFESSCDRTHGARTVLNPKRLLCSTYKARDVTPSPTRERVQSAKQSSSESHSMNVIRDLSSRTNPRDGKVFVNPDRLLDPLFCVSRADEDENIIPRERKSAGDIQEHTSGFDPYYSQPSIGSLGTFCATGSANSAVGDEGINCLRGVVPSKTCVPRRLPAWYQRPDSIATDASHEAHIMHVVFYQRENSSLTDRHDIPY